jgi:hypothetical protein
MVPGRLRLFKQGARTNVRRRSTIAVGLVMVLAGCGLVLAQPSEAQVKVQALSDLAGTYVALAPTRIADTRSNSGFQNAGRRLGQAGTLGVQVSGVGGVPNTGVAAAVMNVTVVDPTTESFVTVFPEGTTQPVVANLNFGAGETISNLVTVPIGSQGGVTIYNHSGSTDVVVDIEGYYTTTAESTGLYDPVPPVRLFGTLTGGGAVGPGASQSVLVTGGATGVPAGASAVVANVTAAGSAEAGFLTAFPAPNTGAPTPPPTASVTFAAGQAIGNRVIIPVGKNGSIEIYNHTGTTHVDVDLYGYYTGAAGQLGSAFVPIAPTRVTDTRVGANGTPISAGSEQNFNFLSDGVPSPATALVANVTVLSGGDSGYLAIFPSTDSIPPGVGDINFAAKAISQDLALAPLNGAATELFNSSATPVNIVIDAFGYFAPPPPAVHVVANPAGLAANGSSTSTLTVTVTTGSGVAFDDPVSITTTPSVVGSCGTASATGSTNASGQVTSTYTASTTAGTCTITATEANGGVTGSVVITQT